MKARMSALEGRVDVVLVCLFKIEIPAPGA
jgi:hypothetical protein